MRRQCVLGIVLVIVGMLLAGTGLAAAPVTTLRFVWFTDGPDRPAIEALVKRFNESNPDIKVDFSIVPFAELNQLLLTQASAGQAPDLARVTEPYRFFQHALDLRPHLKNAAFPREFLDEPLKSITGEKGEVYGIPHDLTVNGNRGKEADMETGTNAVALLLGILNFVFASMAPPAYAGGWTPEQQEVIATMERWERAFHGFNTDELGNLLTNDIEITSAPLGGTFKTKSAFLEAYKKWSEKTRISMGGVTTSTTYEAIDISNRNARVTRTVHWNQKIWEERGGSNIGSKTQVFILRREDGNWKLYSYK